MFTLSASSLPQGVEIVETLVGAAGPSKVASNEVPCKDNSKLPAHALEGENDTKTGSVGNFRTVEFGMG